VVRALTGIAIPTPANITAATMVMRRIGIFVLLKLSISKVTTSMRHEIIL